MKTLSALLLIASISFASAAQTVPLTFGWTASPSTNCNAYRLYSISTPNMGLPLSSWTVVTNIPFSQTNVTFQAPIQNLTYVVTAAFTNVVNTTNFIFEESVPSNPVWTTVVGGGNNLKVSK